MVNRSSLALLLLCSSCRPDLDEAPTTITTPRLIAVRATPAEAKPGDVVQLEAFVAGGDAPIDWALCNERTPLGETGSMAPACAEGSSPLLVPLGSGTKVQVTLPRDACRQFGPERPNPKPGEPAGRPVDPDATGGYYQPVRVVVNGAVSAFGVRLHCGIPSATPEIAAEIEANSTPNRAPTIRDVRLEGSRLRVEHDAPEAYLRYDAEARAIVQQTEVLRASFYATAGTFDEPRAGEPIETNWTAPPGATLWVVLRDDRGGVDVKSIGGGR